MMHLAGGQAGWKGCLHGSAVGWVVTFFAGPGGESWRAMASLQWALCAAGLSAAIVVLEGWNKDPDGIGQTVKLAAVAGATSLLSVFLWTWAAGFR